MYKEVKSEMVKFPYVTSSEMTVKDTIIYMSECRVRHLPVMEKNKLVGIVSERDLKNYKDMDETVLNEVMTRNPYVADEEESLLNVVGIMAEKKYGCALVVNSDDQLIGIFTTIDALKLLKRFLDGDSKFYTSYENVMPLKEVVEWM